MIDRCSPFLSFNSSDLEYIFQLHRNPKPSPRPENEGKYDPKYQGWAKGRLYDSYKESLYTVQAQGWRYRTPGQYGGSEGEKGQSVDTNEVMHASVRERWNAQLKTAWKPESLSGFVPRQMTSGGWEWFKAGKKGQPDTIIEEATIEEKGFEARLRNDTPHHFLYVSS